MGELIELLSGWLRERLGGVGTAIVATVLVLYGARINKAIRRQIRSLHFVGRLAIFVALCACGYATGAVFAGHLLGGLLGKFNDMWLAPIVGVIFVLIGLLAEREGQV